MGPNRGILLAVLVAAIVAVSGGVAGASVARAHGSTTKYDVIYKLSGSFSYDFACPTTCGYSQVAKGSWIYQERFGPFSTQQSTAHVKTSAPSFGGSWSYQEKSSDASTSCQTSGKWNGLNFPPTMSSTEAHTDGFDGVLLVLTAGPDPLGNYYSDPSCTGISFFGSCSTYIGAALAKSPSSNCNKPKYFVTDLSVSDSGLKHHDYVYKVSNSRKGSEQVNEYCNHPPGSTAQGASYSCSYKWSGTVTFKPAG